MPLLPSSRTVRWYCPKLSVVAAAVISTGARGRKMAVCGCCASGDKGEVFKPRNKRWCTDVLCLIFLVIASGVMLAIGYACVSAHPGLIDGLIYPTDGYGNYCGKPGTKTENMPKVFYPDLDNDIVTHSDKLAKQPLLVESATALAEAGARAAAYHVAHPRSPFIPIRQQYLALALIFTQPGSST